jgi:hypothetical protein
VLTFFPKSIAKNLHIPNNSQKPLQYYDRIDEMKDDSEEEMDKFIEDINEKWSELSQLAKKQLNKKFDFVGILKGKDLWS